MEKVSRKPIVRGIERRIVSRFLDLVVLSILDENSREIGGYDIIKYISRKHHLLVSPGLVYSCIHAMEREDLLKARQGGGKRVYTLTQQGRETLRIIQKAENRILRFMSILFLKK